MKMLETPFTTKILQFGVILLLLSVQTLFAADFESDKSSNLPNSKLKLRQTEKLQAGKIRLMQLKGGEKHVFTVDATAENCLRFVIEQQGIDVAITVSEADGKIVKKTDRPSGSYGRETVTLIAPRTGVLTIEIETVLPNAVAGKYQISYTQNNAPTDADRLRDTAENLTAEGETLRSEGSMEDKKKALEKFSEALKIWQNLGDLYEQAVVLYGIGFAYNGLSNFYEAALFFNRSLRLFSEIKDEFGKAINYAALGSVQYPVNENDFAVYNYKKAIEIYRKMDNSRGLGIAFHGLGTVEMLLEKHDEAIADLSESLRWRVLANDNTGKARTHITLGKLYLFLKSYDQAEKQFSEAEKSLGEKRAKKDAELLYYWGK